MNQPQATPPAKLFREPASTGAVDCLACGGPIQLKGFGNVQRVNCPYCGSTLEPQDSGPLQLVEQAQRQRRLSALPLHRRGKIDGTEWEIIGIVWREARVDGITYPWQEFLLFNPYEGFRWLVYSMSDGHWQVGGALDGAPQPNVGIGHRSVRFKGETFKHFQSSPAITTYVEGEFTWQVHVGDQAMSEDYTAPPRSLSVETSQGPGGAEINFTEMRYIASDQVWAAFEMPGSPPHTSGVAINQPNPHTRHRSFYLLAGGILLLLWVAITVLYTGGRSPTVVLDEQSVPLGEVYSQEIELGEPGTKGTILFEFGAQPLSNGWAYADVVLVNQETEEALNFGAEVENWNGVADGESYNEGTNPRRVRLGGVDGGKYLMQIATQVDEKTPTPPTSMRLKITRDVPLYRYVFLPLLAIIFFPLLNLILGAVFEGRRWQNSDYASEIEVD